MKKFIVSIAVGAVIITSLSTLAINKFNTKTNSFGAVSNGSSIVKVNNASTSPVQVTLSTLISGEDPTNNILVVEPRYSYSRVTADTAVKAAAGFVHTVTFMPSDAAATAGSIAICDNATSCGTGTSTIYYVPAAALVPVTITLDQTFASGIYVDFTTTADVNVSVSYR